MESPHGDKCSCQLLSMAATGTPDACHYAYCRNIRNVVGKCTATMGNYLR